MSEPSLPTIKWLFAVSGGVCAFPKCTTPLVDPASGKVTGRICHIKGRSVGGPRYDANQSEEERHGFQNLILMCPIRHDVIDADTTTYSVDYLIQIKATQQQVKHQEIPFDHDCSLIRQHRPIFDRPAFSTPCIYELFLAELDEAVTDAQTALNTGSLYSRKGRMLANMAPKGNYKTPQFIASVSTVSRLLSQLHQLIVNFGSELGRSPSNSDYPRTFCAMALELKRLDNSIQPALDKMDSIDVERNNILSEINSLLLLGNDHPLPFPLIQLSSKTELGAQLAAG